MSKQKLRNAISVKVMMEQMTEAMERRDSDQLCDIMDDVSNWLMSEEEKDVIKKMIMSVIDLVEIANEST